MLAIETINLTKKIKDKVIIENINLKVEQGDIYGFIGRNGAGKSTTLKIISKLFKQTSGKVLIFNKPNTDVLLNNEVGVLIEDVGYYPNMTAYENLKAKSYLIGLKNDKNIKSVMSTVRLENSNKKVKDFSLGMKQRLGIAMAMLGNPKILILDEPVNSLDAEGIVEMREIFKDLNKQGITLLISSHILGELEKIVTKIGIIKNGVLIEELTKDEFNKKLESKLIFEIDNIEKVEKLLNTDVFNIKCKIIDDRLEVYGKVNTQDIINILNNNNISIKNIFNEQDDLEKYFINLMEDNKNEQLNKARII